MNKIATMYWTARAIGIPNLPRRVWQTVKGKLGVHRHRLPGRELSSDELRRQFVEDYDPADELTYWRARANKFFVSPERLGGIREGLARMVDDEIWAKRVTQVVRNLPEGRMLFFNHSYAETGWPVVFNRDPVHKLDWPTPRHWSTYVQFDPKLSDIKCIWEASRFSLAYFLTRCLVRSDDASAAELFWKMFDTWDQQNPYGLTPQWACGQESTFRLMAWLFAACPLLNAPNAEARHYRRLTELAWYTGRHIEFNINYARSQKNNHAISEAVGLWTIGLLFSELRTAEKWRKKGARILADECQRQIYDDGSYVQHSLNYHRVMIDDLLWALRLAQINEMPLPEAVRDGLARALRWLLQMIDPKTGRVPNYGANDGALVLPLSCCDYLDHRPTAQAAHYLLYQKRCFPPGPWDELMLWLCGAQSLDAAIEPASRSTAKFHTGGYYTLHSGESWAMIRCHTYRDRPGQADMLHLDLWWRGQNILRDAGSYSYNCPHPWKHHFASTSAHNTIEIDQRDQMIKGPRFLWFDWTRARFLDHRRDEEKDTELWRGEHYGYKRSCGVVHRRTVFRNGDTQWTVVDELHGTGTHHVVLHWRLIDADWKWESPGRQLRLELPEGKVWINVECTNDSTPDLEVIRGLESAKEALGWESLYYGERRPSPVIRLSRHGPLPLKIKTSISLGQPFEDNS